MDVLHMNIDISILNGKSNKSFLNRHHHPFLLTSLPPLLLIPAKVEGDVVITTPCGQMGGF